MSDVGKLRRSGGSVFPTVRKSADPFQPEHGEMDFSQDLAEFEAQQSTSVTETEKTEGAVIHEEHRRRQYRQRPRKRKEEEEEEKNEEGEDILIDVTA